MTGSFADQQREAVREDALAAAKRCVRLVVEGDPDAPPGSFPSTDRRNNAQAALALGQLARTLSEGRRS